MKFYSEEVARNLLWMKPGAKFWWRQTAVGPIATAEIVEVNVEKEYVLCCTDTKTAYYVVNFRLDLDQPQHMATYPGEE